MCMYVYVFVKRALVDKSKFRFLENEFNSRFEFLFLKYAKENADSVCGVGRRLS